MGVVAFTALVFILLRPMGWGPAQEPRGPDEAISKPEPRPGWGNPGHEAVEWAVAEAEEYGPDIDYEALAEGRDGEFLVRFRDQAALERFLAAMRKAGLAAPHVSRILRTALLNADQFKLAQGLLDPGDEVLPNYYVFTPAPPQQGEVQEGAVGFGGSLPAWLGASGDRSTWGWGVLVAVVDSGLTSHANLPAGTREIDLVGQGGRSSHGTAVASLISGNGDLAPGLAPAANLLSVRVTDASGMSSSLLLAEGIIAAADYGAHLINISLGSTGDSAVVRDAIAYAQARGALIVAAAGNEGTSGLDYPAAYPGVVSVGSVDANSNHLDFSNTGNGITTAAPGLDLNAAWQTDQYIRFSGTSASTAVVTGALAAIMSFDTSGQTSASEALALYKAYLNDAGPPGNDIYYGGGIPDLARILERGTPGIFDAAVAGQVLEPATQPGYNPTWLVTVQNRGTEALVNTSVDIRTPGGTVTRNITIIRPGAIATVGIPFAPQWLDAAAATTITATASVDIGTHDQRPANNTRADAASVKK